MITNNISNVDSPVYAAELNERLVYTESEMEVASWFVKVYDGQIDTDLQYGSRVIKTHLGRENVNYNMLDDAVKNGDLIVWIDVMAGRHVQTPTGIMTVLTEAYEQEMLSSHNLI